MSIYSIMQTLSMKRYLKRFIELETASSLVLFGAALLAMVLANSPLDNLHDKFIDFSLFWVNEGLMAIFFLVVGLELKMGFINRGVTELSDILLPAFGALGGMVIPVLVFCLINYSDVETLRGWATPVATDIAFALGVLSLFGKKVPVQLKLFLLSLAIYDDLGAIIIICLFYSHGLSFTWLAAGALCILCLFILNRAKVFALTPYICLGILLWFALLKSGVHPTLSGVVVAFMIPSIGKDSGVSSLQRLEQNLHPYVAFGVMPLFALVNAGIDFQGITMTHLTSKLVLGISLGLFLGKQLGVCLFSWLLVKLNWAKLPKDSTWLHFYGISLLCGIGFTMSLFLGTLSFSHQGEFLIEVRLGVLLGSLLSGIWGAAVLYFAFKRQQEVIA